MTGISTSVEVLRQQLKVRLEETAVSAADVGAALDTADIWPIHALAAALVPSPEPDEADEPSNNRLYQLQEALPELIKEQLEVLKNQFERLRDFGYDAMLSAKRRALGCEDAATAPEILTLKARISSSELERLQRYEKVLIEMGASPEEALHYGGVALSAFGQFPLSVPFFSTLLRPLNPMGLLEAVESPRPVQASFSTLWMYPPHPHAVELTGVRITSNFAVADGEVTLAVTKCVGWTGDRIENGRPLPSARGADPVSLTAQVSPELLSLAKTVGLVGPDGKVDSAWFEHPLDSLRTILSDSHQRAALLSLMDLAIPSVGDPAGGAARWYPFLDAAGRGNIYLTVDGSVIGIAASLQTPPMVPAAKVSLRVPLLDVSAPTPVAIAGSADAPLELELEATWPAGSHPSRLDVVLSVDTANGGSLRIVFEDLDPADPAGTRIELNPAELDADAARALATLLVDGLGDAAHDDPVLNRVIANLPGVLGLADDLPTLPLHELTGNPAALRSWLSAIAADAADFERWFTRLAGLLGSGLPAAEPTVSGTGTVADPFRAPLLPVQGGALLLTLAADNSTSGPGTLFPGVALELTASGTSVQASASILGIPLGGTAPVVVLPSATVLLLGPVAGDLVDEPDVKVGAVAGGFAWDGTRLVPRLELHDSVLDGTAYPSSTYQRECDRGQRLRGAARCDRFRDGRLPGRRGARGTPRVGCAGQRCGLAPRTGPGCAGGKPHPRDAVVHRAALGASLHNWGHLFGELAAIFGIDGPVVGGGTPENPWRVAVAEEGLVGLELVAWNAADRHTPAGTELLRLGLRASFAVSPWEGAWRTEVLAFDLPPSGSAALRFLGSQHFSLTSRADRDTGDGGGARAGRHVHLGAVRMGARLERGMVSSSRRPHRRRKRRFRRPGDDRSSRTRRSIPKRQTSVSTLVPKPRWTSFACCSQRRCTAGRGRRGSRWCPGRTPPRPARPARRLATPDSR